MCSSMRRSHGENYALLLHLWIAWSRRVLKPTEHMHNEQASKFQEKTFSSRVRESGQLQLINAQSSQALSTIQEYKAGYCRSSLGTPTSLGYTINARKMGPSSARIHVSFCVDTKTYVNSCNLCSICLAASTGNISCPTSSPGLEFGRVEDYDVLSVGPGT